MTKRKLQLLLGVVAVKFALFVLLVGVLPAIAVMLTITGASTTPCLSIGATNMDAILATIRQVESGDNYNAQAPRSSASGAYQFTDATWGHFAGFRRAVNAPPALQDQRAIEHVNEILTRTGGDITLIGPIWYIGHTPTGTEWDRVPFRSAGNVLTPRQYQKKWLDIYTRLAPPTLQDTAADTTSSTTTTQPEPDNNPPNEQVEPAAGEIGCQPGFIGTHDGYALPGQPLSADLLTRPHHDYPAWDWAVVAGTPIYAVTGGTITNIHSFGHNWYTYGCTNNTPGCNACGIGVTITDPTGASWTYCHGTTHTSAVQPGATIQAGTQLMTSGNTGRSRGRNGGYHLHLSLRYNGTSRCPQPLLLAIYHKQPVPHPSTLPTSGCTF